MKRRVEIYCPLCGWRPRESDRWVCLPECGCVWNTFDSGGVCPDCGQVHEETQCLACQRWSPHRSWYHEFGSAPVEEETVREEPFLP